MALSRSDAASVGRESDALEPEVVVLASLYLLPSKEASTPPDNGSD
jgi:hypothetical protein